MTKLRIVLILLLILTLIIGTIGCTDGKPLRIVQTEKRSTTIYWNSLEDYLLNWRINITIHNHGRDIEAGRTRLIVNLYDANGRYATEQQDDLGLLTSGWDATFSLYFSIDENYGPDTYGEATIYLDGEQVDKVAMHF